jgi:hypothetical protein
VVDLVASACRGLSRLDNAKLFNRETLDWNSDLCAIDVDMESRIRSCCRWSPLANYELYICMGADEDRVALRPLSRADSERSRWKTRPGWPAKRHQVNRERDLQYKTQDTRHKIRDTRHKTRVTRQRSTVRHGVALELYLQMEFMLYPEHSLVLSPTPDGNLDG